MALVNPIIWGSGGTPVEEPTTNGIVYVTLAAIDDVLAGGTDE